MIISRAQRNITIFSKINKCSPYTSNLVLSKITIVSGHMIRTFKFKSKFYFFSYLGGPGGLIRRT